MKSEKTKNIIIIGLLAILIVTLAWIVYFNDTSPNKPTDTDSSLDKVDNNQAKDNTANPVTDANKMDLVVYLQDKQAAITSDCGITYAETISVIKTQAVADTSLRYLFAGELAQYGKFGSVKIVDKVAEVTIVNENDPTGLRISSLSSCQARHLFAVLNDTLTQYDSIDSVELHSPTGKIEF